MWMPDLDSYIQVAALEGMLRPETRMVGLRDCESS